MLIKFDNERTVDLAEINDKASYIIESSVIDEYSVLSVIRYAEAIKNGKDIMLKLQVQRAFPRRDGKGYKLNSVTESYIHTNCKSVEQVKFITIGYWSFE